MEDNQANLSCNTATVTGLQGPLALIEVSRVSACEGCREQGHCAVMLEGPRPGRSLVENPLGARPGDTVEVALPESVVLRGALTVYSLPLAVMFAVLLLAGHLKGSLAPDWSEAAFDCTAAALGLAIGLLLARLVSRRSKALATRPRITRIISRAQ